MKRVEDFLEPDETQTSGVERVPVGLILAGQGSQLRAALFESILESTRSQPSRAYALLGAGDCSNLKSLLRVLNACATQSFATDSQTVKTPSSKYLNYDLRIIQDWCRDRQVTDVVVAFPDGEAIDATLLTDFVGLLK